MSFAQGLRQTHAARLKWIRIRIVDIKRWVVTIVTQWRPDDQKGGLSRQAPPPVGAPPSPWVLGLKDRPQHRYKHSNKLLNLTLHVIFAFSYVIGYGWYFIREAGFPHLCGFRMFRLGKNDARESRNSLKQTKHCGFKYFSFTECFRQDWKSERRHLGDVCGTLLANQTGLKINTR